MLGLPKGYEGVVARRTERVERPCEAEGLQRKRRRVGDEKRYHDDDSEDTEHDQDGEEDEPEPEVKIMEEVGTFNSVVVWGHDRMPGVNDGGGGDGGDVYVRGMEEWIGVAEAVHGKPWSSEVD